MDKNIDKCNAVVVVWKGIYSRLDISSYPHPHKQDWGRGFILLLPQAAVLLGSDAGSDVVKPASSFVIQKGSVT